MPKTKTKVIHPVNNYDKYSLAESLDRTLIEILAGKKLEQYHGLTQIKIVIGLIMVAFPAVAFYYRHEWPSNYNIVLVSTIGFMLFYTLFELFERFVEKGAFYITKDFVLLDRMNKGMQELMMLSNILDFDDKYRLSIVGKGREKSLSKEYLESVGSFFDSDGFLHKEKVNNFYETCMKDFSNHWRKEKSS